MATCMVCLQELQRSTDGAVSCGCGVSFPIVKDICTQLRQALESAPLLPLPDNDPYLQREYPNLAGWIREYSQWYNQTRTQALSL